MWNTVAIHHECYFLSNFICISKQAMHMQRPLPQIWQVGGGGGAPLDETLGGIVIINVQCVDPYQGDMDGVKLCDGSVLDFLNNCCWVLCFRKPFQELE